jgi:hypothetical protein
MASQSPPMPTLPPGTRKQLIDELHDLHHRAGWPSMRRIGRAIGCSHTTVSKVFSAPEPPSWEIVSMVVTTLGGEIDHFQRLWYEATGGTGGRPTPGESAPALAGLVASSAPALAGLVASSVPSALSTQESLLAQLDSLSCLLQAYDVLLRLEWVEEVTLAACRRQLMDDLCSRMDVNGRSPGQARLRFGDHVMHVTVQPDLTCSRTLQVSIADESLPMARHTRDEVSLGRHAGRFDRVCIRVPESLGECFIGMCTSRIMALLTSAYEWLGQKLLRSFELLESPFEKEALAILRKCLTGIPAISASGRVFAVTVTNDRVSYAVDSQVVRSVLTEAQSDPDRWQAPAVVVSDLLFNSIPFESSFSCRAAMERRTIPVEFSRAPYQRIAQNYLLAQTVVHRGPYVLEPLANGRNVLMLVAYPVEMRAALARSVSSARCQLGNYMRAAQATLRLPVIRSAENPPDIVLGS